MLSKRSNKKMPGGGVMIDKGRPILQGNSYARELKEMPDHSNEKTRATEAKLGPFVYDDGNEAASPDIIKRGPYELDNGAIFEGDWTKDGLR
jgi:hypothetical protein